MEGILMVARLSIGFFTENSISMVRK